ncbi:MAG: CPBP family intramembrane glutamic endopeptidase [Myxococcota bacterium]
MDEGRGEPGGGGGPLRDDAGGSEAGPPPPEVFVRFGLVFYGAMAAVAVLWRVGWQGQAIWTFAGPASAALSTFARDLGLGVAVGGVLLGLSSLATRRTRWGEDLARSLAGALGPLSVPDALLLATASGLAEELLFRGALQPVVGWLWASLLFGVLHFVPRREFAPWTVFAIGAGLLFGGLYQWTGNLTAPVVAHTLVNGVNLPKLVREYGSGVSRPGR